MKSISILYCFSLLSSLVCAVEWASIDGSKNNPQLPLQGSAGSPFLRLFRSTPPDYSTFPSARAVSSKVFAANPKLVSTAISALGIAFANQYAFDLCNCGTATTEDFSIPVPPCDAVYDPGCLGDRLIDVKRNAVHPSSPPGGQRLQVSVGSMWMDGDDLYGFSAEASRSMRELAGGRVVMPNNSTFGSSLPLPAVGASGLFAFPDFRFNLTPVTQAVGTVWLREHNRYAAELAKADPSLTDEQLYQRARARVVALRNKAFVYEYLPRLLGRGLPPYTGYRAADPAGVYSEFCTVAWRYGHTAQNAVINRVLPSGPAPEGPLLARDVFLNTKPVRTWNVDSLLYGAAVNPESEPNAAVIKDMTDLLPLGPAKDARRSPYIDLAAVNIQRGRDHGLVDYNSARVELGLAPFTSFSEFRPECRAALASLYASINAIDLYVGGMCEPQRPSAHLGEVMALLIERQIAALRDADRFWFENPGSPGYAVVTQGAAPPTTDATSSEYYPGRRLSARQYGSTSSSTSSSLAYVSANSSVWDNPKWPGIKRDTYAWVVLSNTDKLGTFPSQPMALGGLVPSNPLETGASRGKGSVELQPWYKLSWVVDEQKKTVKFTAVVQGDSAVGLGFSTTAMVGADIVLGWRNPAGAFVVQDSHAPSFGKPVADTALGGADSLTGASFTVAGGVSTLTFTRKWDTGDARTDKVIDPSATLGIIFAGPPHELTVHAPSRRGQAVINLLTGASVVGKTYAASQYVHAGGMAFGWGICAPLAVYYVRYAKTSHRWWLSAHKVFIGFAAGSILPLFVTAAVNTNKSRIGSAYHPTAAFAFLAFVLTQVWLGNALAWFLTKSTYVTKYKFHVMRVAHRHGGRLVVVVGWIQVITGLQALAVAWEYWIALGLWFAFITGLFACKEWEARRPVRETTLDKAGTATAGGPSDPSGLKATLDGSAGQPGALASISRVAFESAVARGKRWCIIDGYVVDLSGVFDSHAGGNAVLQRFVGLDASLAFVGLGKAGSHSHSKNAIRSMISSRVARLESSSSPDAVTGGDSAKRLSVNSIACSITSLKLLLVEGPRVLMMMTLAPKVLGDGQLLSLPTIVPGHHVTFALVGESGGITARDFTPISTVQDTHAVTFLIRLIPGGAISELLRPLKVGSAIHVGLYHPRGVPIAVAEGCRHLLFVAAGTGVAAFYGYLLQIAERGFSASTDVPVTLVVFNRGTEILADELAAVAANLPEGAVRIVPVLTSAPRGWKGREGRLTPDLIRDILDDSSGAVVPRSATFAYYCGPPEFEKACPAILVKAGLSQGNLLSLNPNLEQSSAPAKAVEGDSDRTPPPARPERPPKRGEPKREADDADEGATQQQPALAMKPAPPMPPSKPGTPQPPAAITPIKPKGVAVLPPPPPIPGTVPGDSQSPQSPKARKTVVLP